MLVATGFWPPQIEFEAKEMATVIQLINEERKAARRAR